ncbi:MAG: radical SAM protein [Alphaproteobacteria bacterium]|nr:radical SAM protein [Alphaproteobacteria bacterium]
MASHVALTSPRIVAFEVTTRCNLKCVMCPHGIGAIVEPRDADAALLEAIWPAMEAADLLHLNGVGEPLLAAPFWTVIDRLKGRARPRISFNTNGLLLTDTNIDRLRDAPLDGIWVSIDAATEATYERIRGGSFAKVIDGVRRLVGRPGDRRGVTITFVVMRENFAEMVPFVELAYDLGVPKVWFGPLTETAISAEAWTVTRSDGWQFRYKEQQIQTTDEQLIARLRAATDRGRHLGVEVEGINIMSLP